MTKQPQISIIMPVYNSEQYIEQALISIKNSTFKDYEIIIIDDASADSTIEIAKKYNPDVILINTKNKGPAYSRNKAAKIAKGNILYFTDSDIKLQKTTMQKIFDHFQDKTINCVIGLYSLPSKKLNLTTIYKNTWIRFSYLAAPQHVDWFFTAIGAIRKQSWDNHQNFAHYKYKTGGEDIDFGFTFSSSGNKILLDKTLEVNHLRTYSFKYLLKNDFNRAFGYASIALKSLKVFGNVPKKGFANISPGFITGTILSFSSLSALGCSVISGRFLLLIPLFFILYLLLNIKFYLYLKNHFSFTTAFSSIGIMFIDQIICFTGVTTAVAYSFFSLFRKKKPI